MQHLENIFIFLSSQGHCNTPSRYQYINVHSFFLECAMHALPINRIIFWSVSVPCRTSFPCHSYAVIKSLPYGTLDHYAGPPTPDPAIVIDNWPSTFPKPLAYCRLKSMLGKCCATVMHVTAVYDGSAYLNVESTFALQSYCLLLSFIPGSR